MTERMKREYVVLSVGDGGELAVVATQRDRLKGCEKWIQAEGEPGIVYQPAALLGPSRMVTIEMVRRAKLSPTEAPAEEPKEEGGDEGTKDV